MSADAPDKSDDGEMDESDREMGDTKAAWMIRGIVVGAMVIGSANALSYFARSSGWGGLLGRLDPQDEAIGFPLTVWRENGGYGGHALQIVPFVVMIVSALALGIALGGWAISHRRSLDRVLSKLATGGEPSWRTNFSIQSLMLITVLSALAAAAVVNPRVETLAAIYVLGPAALILVSFIPRRIKWQQRVAVLVPLTFITIAVAIALGMQLRIEFDKVLMGIFICWTPQAAFGAIALTGWILYHELKPQSAAA